MDRDLAATVAELVGDLRAMDAVGAIELAEWPAAARLVDWVERRPTQGAEAP